MSHQLSLHDRLMARYGNQKEEFQPLNIPEIGRIDSDTVDRVQQLAIRAQAGEIAARDHLYFALQPRLNRVSWVLRPWPNSSRITGIWDRGDVRQESWIVFAELLALWDGNASFISYLFARLAWRLRDRILRGIGKRQVQYGEIRVSEARLVNKLVAKDEDQPESAAIARKLLEVLVRQSMMGATTPGELGAWRELVNMYDTEGLISPDQMLEAEDLGERSRVA